MTPNLPVVSIGLPVLNGQNYVASALRCLLSQSYTNLEIVVSDNASDDGTETICRKMASADRRVIYSRVDRRVSLTDNWNRAFALSSAELFMWAAHDDLWEPQYVESLVGLLMTDPTAIFALTAFDMIDGKGSVISADPCRFNDFRSENLYLRLLAFIASEFMGKGNAVHGLIRREALDRVRGASSFNDVLTPGDWLLIFRLLSLGHFSYDNRLLFHKRDGYTKPSTPRSATDQLAHQYRECRDYLRYTRLINFEISTLVGLSASQQAELRRFSNLQLIYLFARKAQVLGMATRRRLAHSISPNELIDKAACHVKAYDSALHE